MAKPKKRPTKLSCAVCALLIDIVGKGDSKSLGPKARVYEALTTPNPFRRLRGAPTIRATAAPAHLKRALSSHGWASYSALLRTLAAR